MEHTAATLETAAKTFERKGFRTIVCATGQQAHEAASALLDELAPEVIGFGNSQTLRDLGIVDLAKEREGCTVLVHDPRNYIPVEDRRAMLAKVYFTSANAISQDGHIVNIDGTGNRTGATCYGPEHIIYVVGKNKLVPDLDAALVRAREAAIRLATVYGRNTPCAKTGRCHDCIAPDCVCGVTTIHRKALIGNTITVLLVAEDLGI